MISVIIINIVSFTNYLRGDSIYDKEQSYY